MAIIPYVTIADDPWKPQNDSPVTQNSLGLRVHKRVRCKPGRNGATFTRKALGAAMLNYARPSLGLVLLLCTLPGFAGTLWKCTSPSGVIAYTNSLSSVDKKVCKA